MSLSPPVQITVPFATGGLKNAIPANANPTDGHAGYDVGFPAINMTPKTAGGIPPFGQDFNGIFFEISTAIQFLEAGGSFPYSSSFSTAVGGYPIGAIVSRTDGSGLWRNTVANNTTNPETFGAGWQPEDAGSSAIAMTNANVTLTALQAARSIITITGVLTSNLQLIMPIYVKQWLIVNNCTGAFTITAKTAAGSGVVIPSGSTQPIYGEGVNINPSFQKGVARFTSSGSFTVPVGVTTIFVSGCAGGGGGGSSLATNSTSYVTGGSGGGAGQSAIRVPITVTPGQVIPITVGLGGNGATAATNNATAGGVTQLGTAGALLNLLGGGQGLLGGGGTAVPSNYGGPAGGAGFPAGSAATDTNAFAAGGSNATGGIGGAGGSTPFGNSGPPGRGATSACPPAGAGFGFGAGGSGAGGAYNSTITAAGGAGAAGMPGLLILEW